MAQPEMIHRTMYEEMIRALEDEIGDLRRLLAGLPVEAWTQATRLPGWDVLILTAHLAHGVGMFTEYAKDPTSESPQIDRATYYRYDAAAMAPGVDRRARSAAHGQTPETLQTVLAEKAQIALETARSLEPSTIIVSRRGPIRLDDFLATRVLEACVHGLDLRAAVGAPPTPTSRALAVTVSLLEQMLGAQKPEGLDDIAFVEVATGRRPSTDSRFPLLQ